MGALWKAAKSTFIHVPDVVSCFRHGLGGPVGCAEGGHSWGLVVTRAHLSARDKCWFQGTEGPSPAPPTLTTTVTTQAGGELVVRAPAGKGEFQNVPRAWPQAPDTRSWRRPTPSAL